MSQGALVSPSILAADFTRLGEEVQAIERAGADMIHYDVMDDHFVPNLTFGYKLIREVMGISSLPADIHLMIDNPEEKIDGYLQLRPLRLSFHLEACRKPQALLEKIHAAGVSACAAVRPTTPLTDLEPWLEKLDGVLVMLVEPGFAGQKMLPETVSRIGQVQRLAEINNTDLEIQIDGGIKQNNFRELVDLGANNLVLGSGIFASGDYAAVIGDIKQYRSS